MLSMTLWLLTVLVPLQIELGDQHGLNTLRYQPEKVAAMEGDWETRGEMPLVLFGWPDEAAETTRRPSGRLSASPRRTTIASRRSFWVWCRARRFRCD